MLDLEKLMKEVHSATDVYTNQHFVYTGNAHGDGYVNYRALGKNENVDLLRKATEALFSKILEQASLDQDKPITIVGPETIGALMVEQLKDSDYFSVEMNHLIFKKAPGEKQFVWSEDPSDIIEPNSQIVWVDDLLNAGSTFVATKKLVEEAGGTIKAIGVFGDRSGLSIEDLGVPYIVALETLSLERYGLDEGPCPLCVEEVPIVTNLGHGAKFQESNPDYSGGYTQV